LERAHTQFSIGLFILEIMRCAVIDLGTNTFHLMIVEKDSTGIWTILVRHRIYVKLAEDGIRMIGEKAFKRGLDAIKIFKTQLDAAEINPKNIKAFGTAALRTAQNGREFIQKMAEIHNIRAETISGDQEAKLIYRGVKRAVPFPDGRVLIMDIGGGSVEFIIANRNKIFWQKSIDIGVSVLFQNFHKSDPIASEEVIAIEDFLDIALKDLWKALKDKPVQALVGASGAFDVVDNFLIDPLTKPSLYAWIKAEKFDAIYKKLAESTLEERQEMPQLSAERMEMIVVAVVLIRFILERTGIKEIFTSEYSMKEGMLEEYF
jgi:exopolyphosphatase / guanosine-5'-triphosphate,3'-diphosphate pyrophosphatase